jgi:hypothetical protein
MNPKEKAKELVDKMLYQIDWNAQESTFKMVAKECSLIAVNELIANEHLEAGDNPYWIRVKQEIQAL